ncbi:unnamed protein product [Euphydryas editha]|uniref:Uncharacterized protein n=1 Tax=Euphydryas editha TaxID=104508 RepID=A0AAU9UAN8_EUPED|nr:unnamed protein product [Euphydryas editha]
MKASKAQDAKNRAKLTSDKHKFLAGIKEEKGNFMMQDAPESKKGKRSVSRIGIPCPQLPGVPAVPSSRKPQPREVLCSLGTIAQAIVVGQLTDPLVPKPVMGKTNGFYWSSKKIV